MIFYLIYIIIYDIGYYKIVLSRLLLLYSRVGTYIHLLYGSGLYNFGPSELVLNI